MTFGRLSVGLLVAGCLVAGTLGAGCAGGGGGGDETAIGENAEAMQSSATPVPTISPTTVPNPPWLPTFRPQIDNPQEACDAVYSGSQFEGYLIEMAAGDTCPDISTSLGTWEEDPGDCTEAICYANQVVIGKAYYIGATPETACRYKRKVSTSPYTFYPPPTPEMYYGKLKTALGYPDQISRDIQGILCVKTSDILMASVVATPDAYIPVCRKCALANANRVSL